MALTRTERDDLLARAWAIDKQLYPDDPESAPEGRAAVLLRENYYQILAEYADRLPRIVMSVCPLTGEPFKHSFDPFGVDGPWWHQDREVEIDEPEPPDTFRVLLGALAFHGREPTESRDQVIPGPEVPFVVPRLLELPGMVAVVSRLQPETGDIAYPVAYYSPEEIPQQRLHQHWLQQEHFFEIEAGKSSWLIANDVWDFDLEPWIRSGKLRWTDPDDSGALVPAGDAGGRCPYLDLTGDRFPQGLAGGQRELMELPDGTAINPYEDEEAE
jgi:hypothetical protein